MKVLVTGAAGFIGSHTVRELSNRGLDVTGTDQVSSNNIISGDITELQQIVEVIERTKPDAVVHLAAISGATGKNEAEQSLSQPLKNFRVNVLGTANVCEACRMNNVGKLVYMSSFAVYGRTDHDRLPITERTPTSPEHAYAVSKLAGEEVVRTYSKDFGIKSAVIRAPFIAGEDQKERIVLREFIECAATGNRLVVLGDGKHVREFIHPADLADAFAKVLLFLDGVSASELFVVGNERVTIMDLAGLVVKHMGKGKVDYLHSTSARPFDQYSDHRKASQLLKWHPRLSVEEIIEKIIVTEFSKARYKPALEDT